VNGLAEDQQEVCRSFAARGIDKFAGISHRVSANGSPVIDDVIAWIDCSLHAVHEAGDHYIVLGRVHDLGVGRAAPPLLFFRGGYGTFSDLGLAS
jgi:3-hydroxy-9,10-secoandrosta-1,3,5(10)-triene-9,17-dione monooxygenase reductase component